MKFDARGGISILQLVVFFPVHLITFYLIKRWGFRRSFSWILLNSFSLIRVVGACCQLATYSRPSEGLFETVVILDSIGVSPLLLASSALISRWLKDAPDATYKGFFTKIQTHSIHGLVIAATALGIYGGTHAIKPNGTYKPQATSKIGVILYIAAFLAVVNFSLSSLIRGRRSASPEKRLVLAVLVALPLIAVRLIYSILTVFLHNHDFSIIHGSVAIWAVMAVLEEIVVVLVYVTVGLMTGSGLGVRRDDAPSKISDTPLTYRGH